jgi:hypothetical protein
MTEQGIAAIQHFFTLVFAVTGVYPIVMVISSWLAGKIPQ